MTMPEPDLPRRRDPTARGLGGHRRPTPLRDRGRAPWLPRLAGWLTGVVGAINVVLALTPELAGRAALLTHLVPSSLVVAAHALALPAGLALGVLAFYLRRGRRRALWVAVAVLLGVGGLDLVKGLDVEETLVSWGLAGVLLWGRDAFRVGHEVRSLRAAVARVGLTAGLAGAAGLTAVVAASHWATTTLTAGLAVRETAALLALTTGPMHFVGPFAWLPLGVGLIAVGALVLAAWTLFRPLRAALGPPAAEARLRARRIVRRHGQDTLAYFKLRRDVHRLFSDDGQAFLAYRVEAGVLLVSGDPIGPSDALPALLRKTAAFADERGLRLGAVGTSGAVAALARDAGLRALYLGDEAILDTARFSLEGRPIRKVRQSVTRLEKAGYRVEARRFGLLEPAELAALEEVARRWRDGAPERGFSMAMDGLRGDHPDDATVVIARDGSGAIRGFVHFVPAYGRPALSLSAMCRDRDVPNGLTELLIARGTELLRERGVAELSLNFAAFARVLHSPADRAERVLGALIRRADPYFQIESLYAFNAKFRPRWEPRYLLYEGAARLPRTALATLWVEGHLPKPQRPRRLARRQPAIAV